MRTVLDITGMHCASCASIITRGLKKTPGVQDANVNYAIARATVEHGPDVTTDKIIAAVKATGYGASVRDPDADYSSHDHDHHLMMEENSLRRRFIISVALSLPALLISMILMEESPFFIGWELPAAHLMLFLLVTPVQFY